MVEWLIAGIVAMTIFCLWADKPLDIIDYITCIAFVVGGYVSLVILLIIYFINNHYKTF